MSVGKKKLYRLYRITHFIAVFNITNTLSSKLLKRKQPWNSVAYLATFSLNLPTFQQPKGLFSPQKQVATNLATFPSAIADFSGILETNIKAHIVSLHCRQRHSHTSLQLESCAAIGNYSQEQSRAKKRLSLICFKPFH